LAKKSRIKRQYSLIDTDNSSEVPAMTISTSVRKWTERSKHALWAFLFLTSYAISMVAPFVPVAKAEVNPVSNPSMAQACGLDIALVIDNSLSIDSSEMSQMKSALTAFVDALSGTPTEFSVTRFSSSAQVVQSFSSSATTVKAAINGVSTSSGYTNWEDALLKANSTLPNRANPNLVIFATDGDPTTSNTIGGLDTNQPNAHLSPAISAANTIKTGGTRILALGIGLGGSSVDRLKSISGPNANTGNVLTSDVISSNFSTLAADLATFASQTCGGTITTQKLIDADGNLQTTNDQTPASGWVFDVNGGSNPAATTTDSNGLTPAVKVTSGSGYSVTETVKPGYSILKASCSGATNNGTWSGGGTLAGLQVSVNNIIRCTFINTQDRGSVKLIKEVDTTYGGTLGVNDFGLSIGGTSVTSGQTLTLPVGVPVAINEVGAAGYSFVSITGSGCPATLGGTVTPVKDQVITCTIKNASKPATLMVIKHVINDDGGWKTADDFTMNVAGTNVSTSNFPGSEAGVAVTLKAGSYSVDEDNDSGYEKTIGYNCSGSISVGETKTCTITNNDIAPTLTLVKKVINNNGGVAVPTDWILSATGTYANPSIISGKHGSGTVTNAVVKAGDYTLSESGGPSGYTSEGWVCSGATLNGSTLSLEPGQNSTCTVTNNDDTPYLQLIKVVTNDDGGTAKVNDWLLSASGTGAAASSSFSGTSGVDSTIVNNFQAGSYALTESNGPSGYDPSAWSCVGGSINSNLITVALGQRVVCTITNNDRPGTITVIKNVDDGFGHITTDVKNWTWNYDSIKKDKHYIATGSNNTQSVPAGTYTVSENQKPGYQVIASKCTGGYSNPYDKSGWSHGGGYNHASTSQTVKVGLGQNIICEFTNKRDTGMITVHKKIGDKVDPQGWTWWLGNSENLNDMGDTEKVASGWYWFGENQKDGYSFESLKCKVDGHYIWINQDIKAKVYVGKNDRVECTFTNSRDTGDVTIVKDAQPDSNQEFEFTIEPVSTEIVDESQSGSFVSEVITGETEDAASDPTTSFTLVDTGMNDGKNSHTSSLETGKYRISESAVDGWDLSDISCGEAQVQIEDGVVYVYVTKGMHVQCTFTNTKRAQLTIVKDASMNSSRSFSFTSTLTDGVSDNVAFSLVDDGTGTMSSKQFGNLLPGTYTITETSTTSWRLDDISCTGTGVTMVRNGHVLSVTLAAGAVASCTFVNTFVPQVLGTATTTLVDTGADTVIAAAIALLLTAAAIVVSLQRQKAYVTVRKD
jgi:hypothetical protein